MANLQLHIDQFSSVRVLCVGDVMLDIFVYGKTNRLSPEAPVPVLLETRRSSMLGGAGNVVANLRSLGVQTSLAGIVGNDAEGKEVRKCLEDMGAESKLLFTQDDYQTTMKTRLVSGRQHLLRLDRETMLYATDDNLNVLLSNIEQELKHTDMLLLSDYKKGLIDERFAPRVIEMCRAAGVPVIVDPKRTDYGIYRGATLVKPNRKEFEEVTGQRFSPGKPGFVESAVQAGREVCHKYGVENLLVTLSEHGMLYIPGDETERPRMIPTEAKEVFDVSGAGDTSLATLGAAIATGATMRDAIKLANAASGVVVGKLGTASITCDELRRKIDCREESGIITAEQAAALISELKEQGKTIGFTNGCFDILHPGHLSSFDRARALCDVLFVGLNSDASIQRLKGPTRPINNQESRAAMLVGLKSVNYVVIFDEDSPLTLIDKLRPDVIAKEGYAMDNWKSGRFVESYGGKAVILPRLEGFSTTAIVEKLNK